MFGLLCVSSSSTTNTLLQSSEAATCVTVTWDNPSTSAWMDQTMVWYIGGLDWTSMCATSCWTSDSSLLEAKEINSLEITCTTLCATGDESVVVASGSLGTSTTSLDSRLNCSTTSECMSTCVTWGINSNTVLVGWGRSPCGISSDQDSCAVAKYVLGGRIINEQRRAYRTRNFSKGPSHPIFLRQFH